jgi:hypothetical protein
MELLGRAARQSGKAQGLEVSHPLRSNQIKSNSFTGAGPRGVAGYTDPTLARGVKPARPLGSFELCSADIFVVLP